MMKRIGIICPYFGTLPEHFQLFLNSCVINKTITWFLITDDKRPFDYPDNVKVSYTTLSSLKAEYQKKFDFPISLEGTYKLGDFKPLYGYLYEDTLLKGYDAWGHIDVGDEIYGDIRQFVTDELLDKYDKLMVFGHMCIYRNTAEVNRRFMLPSDINLTYRQIFSSSKFFNFEEIAPGSITRIYLHNNYPIGRMDDYYADISGIHYAFWLGRWSEDYKSLRYFKKVPLIFSWENGHVFGYSVEGGILNKKEYIYVHFKRRKMNVNVNPEANKYLIVPHGFEPLKGEVNIEIVRTYSKDKVFYKMFFIEKKKVAKIKINKLIANIIKLAGAVIKPFMLLLPAKQFLQVK